MLNVACLNIKFFKFLFSKCNFHPLEVVNRGCETQLQKGENLNMFSLSLSLLMLFWVLDSSGPVWDVLVSPVWRLHLLPWSRSGSRS